MVKRKSIIFPSVIAICVACPALAVDIDTTGKINGTNAMCNVNSALESDSGAKFVAKWEVNTYTCLPGTYLNHLTAACTECTANSWCGGGTYTFDDNADIGINACNSGKGDYPYSAQGATSEYECYTNATTTCAAKNPYYLGHGTANYATSGSINCKIYYGNSMSGGNFCTLDSVSTCNITSLTCDNGYNQTGTNGVLANYVNENTPNDPPFKRSRSLDDSRNSEDQTGLSVGDWEVKWINGTTVRGISSCNSTGGVAEYVNTNRSALLDGKMTPGEFITGFSAVGTQEQTARMSELLTQFSSNAITIDELGMRVVKEFFINQNANYNASVTGQSCWCQMTSYSLQGGTAQSVTSSPWVYLWTLSNCANDCANACTYNLDGDTRIRNAIFGSLGANMECTRTSYTCEPGTYLPANAVVCAQCTTGNYCGGGTFYQTNSDQGIDACPNGYSNSAMGASSDKQCYTTGTVACATFNPLTNSQHLDANGDVTYDNTNATYIEYNDSSAGQILDSIGACAVTDIDCESGYNMGSAGALSNYTVQSMLWFNNTNIKYLALDSDSNTSSSGNGQGATTGMTPGNWEIKWSNNTKVTGTSSCAVNANTTYDCTCSLTSYTITNGSPVSVSPAQNAPVEDTYNTLALCQNACAAECAESISQSSSFRAQLFAAIGANPYCVVNGSVSLNWYNQSSLVETNSCIIGQPITFPSGTYTRTGYHSTGWRLKTAP